MLISRLNIISTKHTGNLKREKRPRRHDQLSYQHQARKINLTAESTAPYLPVRNRYIDSRRITAVNQVLSARSLVVSYPGSVIPPNEASISGKVELGPAPLNIVEGEEEFSVLGNKFRTASVPEAEIDEE